MIIQSTQVWISERFVPAQLELSGGKIWSIQTYGKENCDVDYGDLRILPGFIDIHTHGGYGYDTNDGSIDGLRNYYQNLPKEGVTAFLPTTSTDSQKKLNKALKSIAEAKKRQDGGAQILGIHLEGPFINPKQAGIQTEKYMLEPDVSIFRDFQKQSENEIRIITLAPELDNRYALTRFCSSNNVVVSIGHSNATYQQVLEAYSNGASSITHTFNAQTPLHHRDNGVAGAALIMDSLYSEIIGDTYHVNKEVLNLFFKCKGKDHAILVTDSIRGKGLPVGEHYLFANQAIINNEDGMAVGAKNGKLAGSITPMNQQVKLLIEECNIPIESVINACTSNPATLLKMQDHIGKIQSGHDGNLTIIDDNYDVIQTYCKARPQL